MPKKAELSQKQQDVLAAIASKDISAVSMADIQEVFGEMGLSLVAKGASKEGYSRSAKQREWLSAHALSEEELAVIDRMSDVLGKSVRILDQAGAHHLTVQEIDGLMEEELVRRPMEDIAKGDYQAIRTTLLNALAFDNYKECPGCEGKGEVKNKSRAKDAEPMLVCDNCTGSGDIGDPFPKGEFVSLKHGMKFVIGNQIRTDKSEYAKLEDVLDPEVWESITEVKRTVNEDLLLEAINDGKVSMEAFASTIGSTKTIQTLRVVPVKEGDSIG